MNTAVIRLDEQATFDDAVKRAVDELMRGKLVAFPTETVYGVGARADRQKAVSRLRSVKERGKDRAFTLHIPEPDDARRFAPSLPGVARRFIRKGWPGPLTLIVDVEDPSSAPGVVDLSPPAISAIYYGNTIGMRCPDDRVATAILRNVPAPIVAASANLAGHRPPVCGQDVLTDLNGQISLLLDSGSTKYAKPSTIVHVAGSSYKLLREGVYDAGIVERLWKVRLLFVCTGNTCRSPMAEGLAKRMLAERLGCEVTELADRGVEVWSAGTAGGGGGASEHARCVMEHRGIDIGDHMSRALSADLVQQADYIFVMTEGHRDMVVSMEPSSTERVALLVEGESVKDPIGGSEVDYEACARMVERGLEDRLQEVIV